MVVSDAALSSWITALRYFAFAAIFGGMLFDFFWNLDADFGKRLMYFAMLIAGLAFYNVLLDNGVELFESMYEDSAESIDAYLEKCCEASIESSGGIVDSTLIQFQGIAFQWVTTATVILRKISDLIRDLFVIAFKITAPIMFGLAGFSIGRSHLQQFLIFSLGVAMWSVGYGIADIYIWHLASMFSIPTALGASAQVVIATGSLMAGMLTFVLVVFLATCIFYVLTPLLIFKILSGGNPGSGLMATMRTAAISSMAASKGTGMGYGNTRNNVLSAIKEIIKSGSGSGSDTGNQTAQTNISPIGDNRYPTSSNLKSQMRTAGRG